MMMPHQTIVVPVFVMLLFAAGCGAYMFPFQSSFFSNFSLRKLVERDKTIAGLDCAAGGSGPGGGGMSMGMGGVGNQGSDFSKIESIACQISDAGIFDEAKFIQALQLSIEQELDTEKATIVSKTADASGVNIEYALNKISGTVKISARKGPMRFYTLQADLKEKSK